MEGVVIEKETATIGLRRLFRRVVQRENRD
jgi:hypothetical protein